MRGIAPIGDVSDLKLRKLAIKHWEKTTPVKKQSELKGE
jgi:hypothetical protein